MKKEGMAFPSSMVSWKKTFVQKAHDLMVLWDMLRI